MPRARSRSSSTAPAASWRSSASSSRSPSVSVPIIDSVMLSLMARATSCCWAPSWMLRSIRRRSSSCAATSRCREALISSSRASSCSRSPAFLSTRPTWAARSASSRSSVGVSDSPGRFDTDSAPRTSPRWRTGRIRSAAGYAGTSAAVARAGGSGGASGGQAAPSWNTSPPFSHTSARVAPVPSARILAEGTGATRADVWLKGGEVFHDGAAWPPDAPPLPPARATAADVPAYPAADRILPVRHLGEVLGALSVSKRPGESLTPTEDRLLADLAAQVGLVLKNAGLREQLLARLEEIRASRQRLLAAQDAERRRIERNIHDGAQQQLVALAIKLSITESMIGTDTEGERELLAELRRDAAGAVEDLRDLARGVYPPLLASEGLVTALEAQARKAPVPTSVIADGVGRYPQDVEAAVYFCVLEALQNVAKYAGATRAGVRLAGSGHGLTFEVTDDGAGFDPGRRGYGAGLQGMADRLHAHGGSLAVRSSPGAGTTIAGRVPGRVLEAA